MVTGRSLHSANMRTAGELGPLHLNALQRLHLIVDLR
jgi:hypothetical protein